MCTVNVAPNAEQPLADLLIRLRDAVAVEYGVDPESVLIGPVDFGTAP